MQISARPASLAPPALLNQIAQTSAHFNRCRIPFLCIMENYTLKTSINISKPIVFLCGPYISKNKREDRRIILQQKLLDICDKKVLPLIIDEFLTKENLNFDVNIELLEEIFATISDKTHADDIMLSTRLDSFSSNIDLVEGKLKSLLADLDLKLNLNKRRIEVLDVPGRHIRYVGINIICGKDHNFLTVGKKYIYDTAKEYLNYLNTKDFMPDTIENEGKLEYMTKRIKGRVAFIKQVDGEIGWLKLKRHLGDCEEYYNSFGLVFD